MERVSILLGHRSIRITEKHYAAWVRSRQEQLEQDLRQSWSQDPILLAVVKGTPEVHRSTDPSKCLKNNDIRLVEAAGIEPASEKARHEEPTCVAGSKSSAAASEPARAATA